MVSRKLIYSLSAMFSLSLTIFFKKIALLVGVSPLSLLIHFMIVAALFLNINFFFFQKKAFTIIRDIRKTEWIFLFFAGFFLLSAYISSTFGLRFTSSINYSFIIKSNLVFSTILAYLFLKESLFRQKIVLIIIFFIGIYLVTTGGKAIVPQIGDLLILIAAFFFSVFSILQKKINRHLTPETISWAVSTLGALFALLASVFLKISIFNLANIQGIVLILLAGLTEGLIILFMNKTIRVASVSYYVMMTMLIPVVNGFLGFLFLSETITPVQMLGGIILILSGISVQKLESQSELTHPAN